MKTLVSPSLLAADFLHLKDEIEMINNSEADWLHLDVMGFLCPTYRLVSLFLRQLARFVKSLWTFIS